MVGLNIDERAIPLNERYEVELAETMGDLTSAEAALDSLKKRLEKVNAAEPERFIENVAVAIIKMETEMAITAARGAAMQAQKNLDDAKKKLTIVRLELPLMMEFYHN